MFTSHFKLKSQPFIESMPTDRIQEDDRMSQGLARLKYFAQTGTIALITGQTGVGKSSLLNLFIHSLSRSSYQPVYLHLTNVNANGLLRLIVRGLGEVPARGKENLYLQIIEKARKTELTTILVIDEGHLIDSDSLVDLRLLVSPDLEKGSPMKLVLSGQQILWEQLKRSAHADLVHRINITYHLSPLKSDQTSAYIDFQMRNAGGNDKTFTKDVKELIHDYTGGVPRQINNLATACLINAVTRDMQKINTELVNETMSEFRLP